MASGKFEEVASGKFEEVASGKWQVVSRRLEEVVSRKWKTKGNKEIISFHIASNNCKSLA